AKDPGRLRERLGEVMVRSTRRDALLRLPRRVVETVPVPLSGAEEAFYQDVLAFARALHQRGGAAGERVLPLILLLRELCSSPHAACRTLAVMARSDRLEPDERDWARALAEQACAIAVSARKLAAAERWIAAQGESVLVFTEFRATQTALAERLAA